VCPHTRRPPPPLRGARVVAHAAPLRAHVRARVGRKNVVFSYSEVEKMVRTATSNEPWGASEELKLKIADATYDLCVHHHRHRRHRRHR